MLKLLKYEFRKTMTAKLILIGITAVAEIAFLIGTYMHHDAPLAIGISVLVMAASCSVLLIGLQSMITLHRDMNTKQGYMLFMTPNPAYKILGAKVLECSLSVLLAGAFYLLLGLFDLRLFLRREGMIGGVWNYITNMVLTAYPDLPLNFSGAAALVFSLLCGWIATVNSAYLADAAASALLNGKRFGGLIAFALFIVLSIIMGNLAHYLPVGRTIIETLIINGIGSLLFAVIMYIVTFILMDRKLSV